jgi:YVTN family beta-propeller protein
MDMRTLSPDRRRRVYARRRFVAATCLVAVLGLIAFALQEAWEDHGSFAEQVRQQSAGVVHRPTAPARNAAVPEGSSGVDVYANITTSTLSPAVRGIRPLVYVPNNDSNTVDVIDPKTYKVIRQFGVGSGPQHITPSWDLRNLYVGNTYSNTITVIKPRTGKPTRTIPVFDTYNLYFTPDGKKAIDVAERMNTLFIYNPQTWKVMGKLTIPWAGADHLDFSADGRYLLITTEFAGRLVKVDLRRMKITGSLELGGSPVDVKVSPDGSVFFVANQVRNGVSVVDPVRMKEIAFIHTGKGAHGFCVSRSGKDLYVSNRLAGSISILSFGTRKVVRTWQVGGSPDMMQVTPDGKQLWVSNRYNGTVSVIDTRSGKVLHIIQVGSSPHGLTYFPQPGRYSIGHNGVYR